MSQRWPSTCCGSPSKTLGVLVGSTLLGVNGGFWYLPAILAIGSSVAVIAAFLIDRPSNICALSPDEPLR